MDRLAEGADRPLSWVQAVEEFAQHPSNVKLRECESKFAHYWGDLATDFGMSRGDYMAKAMAREGVPFALLVRGEWIEKGRMGWFGIAHNEEDQDTWNKKVSEYFDSLDPDTILIAIDCHI